MVQDVSDNIWCEEKEPVIKVDVPPGGAASPARPLSPYGNSSKGQTCLSAQLIQPWIQGGPGLPNKPPPEPKHHFPSVLNPSAYYQHSVPVTSRLDRSAGRFTVLYGPPFLQSGEEYFIGQVNGNRDVNEVPEMSENAFQVKSLI
jgi:hypothetical protein